MIRASVSKVPTTLALLRKLGPEYRFVTTFTSRGAVSGGTLRGDLLVESNGDPAFVDENALLVNGPLARVGYHPGSGDLRLRGRLTFDWQSDETEHGCVARSQGRFHRPQLAAVRAFELENPTGPTPAALLPTGIKFLTAANVRPRLLPHDRCSYIAPNAPAIGEVVE